jgi:hypothetical protein
MKTRALLPMALVAAAVAACSVGTSIDDHPCPQGGTTLTYQNFGSGFFAAWCIRCHGGPNGYSSRSFTTAFDIRANKDRIFVNAAADNAFMPPGPDGPTSKEREDLADWLACGAP